MVFRTGVTGLNGENKHVIEYKLTLDSNPEFTSSVLVAFARAAYRMHSEGQVGARPSLTLLRRISTRKAAKRSAQSCCKVHASL